jgi:hypothetical protein
MTVEDHNSRPTLEKLALIAKNKVPFDSARTILQRLYKELMGDLDDLVTGYFILCYSFTFTV